MYEKISVPAIHCTCDVCGYEWTTFGLKVPVRCAGRMCLSHRWNGVKQVGRPKGSGAPSVSKVGQDLPKPRRDRREVTV